MGHDPVPTWDLATVFKGLQVAPFEPLESADLLCLSAKVVFLIAITSAKRIGKLGALVTSFPYLRFFPDRVVLRLDPNLYQRFNLAFTWFRRLFCLCFLILLVLILCLWMLVVHCLAIWNVLRIFVLLQLF